MKSDSKSGVFLVAVSAAAFGIMPIFAKIAYASGTSVYTLLFLRFLAGAVFMTSLMFAKRLPLPKAKEIIAFLLLGAVGYTGQSFCYFTALNYTTTGTVSLLLYTYPVLVTAGSALFFKERINAKKIIALVAAIAGAAAVAGGNFKANLPGILLSAGAALIYTAYILVSSVVVKKGMSVQSSAFIMTGAAFSFGIMNLFAGFEPPADVKGYAAAIAIALVSTVLALWAFFTGMEKTGPSTASLVSTLEPIVTVAASALILSETLTVNTVAGGILIISALVVTVLADK